MKFWKKLSNPFVLAGQGFLAGALLFFAVGGDPSGTQSRPAHSGSVLSTLQS